MKAKKQTFVALVLDESGSMSSMREAAIGLFNTQRETLQKTGKKGGVTKVTFVKFGQNEMPHVNLVFHAREPEKLPELTNQNYIPQNGTPMRDGIGLAIEKLEAEDDGGKDTAFLVVVVTDGQENQSREWSADRLRTKVAELQATGRWTFAVYGSNITLADLQDTGFAVPAGNFQAYQPTAAGLRGASYSAALATDGYLGAREDGATMSVNFTDDKKKKLSRTP